MIEKKRYLEGTRKILEDSQKEREKYFIDILGRKFIVYPGVFSPKYFFDTEFFAKNIKIKQNEEFLEIGSGTGVISIFAAITGASRIVALDINPIAVDNTKENAKINHVDNKVEAKYSDIYSALNKNEKFDTIFWNVPFGFVERKNLTILEKAVFDTNYNSIKKFINDTKKHLKINGRLLIGFSTTLGDFEWLKKTLDKAGFDIKLLSEIESVETHPVKFELFECN